MKAPLILLSALVAVACATSARTAPVTTQQQSRSPASTPAPADWKPFQRVFVSAAEEKDAALLQRARGIHQRVMTMDTHVDISPSNFRTGQANYSQKLPRGQVDLVKMEEGGLDAAFLIAYVGQRPNHDSAGFAAAHAQAIEKFEAVHRLVDSLAPTRVGLARTAADARRIYASGKKVVFIGIENGFQVGTDITNVKKFYDMGGRYMSLAHNNHSQLSDSNTGERDGVWLHNGLSALGRQVIAEMNKYGIMIDVSHPSKLSMMQTLAITRAPVIGSHSAARALCNHSRNMDDEQLLALKQNGGVIQAVAFSGYVKCSQADTAMRNMANRQRNADLDALRRSFGITATDTAARSAQIRALPQQRQNDFLEQQQWIVDRVYIGDPRASVADFVDHIDYIVRKIGVDHVGISSDFDGGGGVVGWNSALETFNVTLELVRRGYTEAEIGKIWSGNLLRVLEQVERVAQQTR
jgi:membrane dipeptidase